MNCSRCRGLMVKDLFLDMAGAYGEMWAQCWRCVNCGQVHDAVIEHNRLVPSEKVLVHVSTEPDYQDDEVYLGAESFIREAA
jgi:uncharacterized Zn finger protein